jgi:hypothetical protein
MGYTQQNLHAGVQHRQNRSFDAYPGNWAKRKGGAKATTQCETQIVGYVPWGSHDLLG